MRRQDRNADFGGRRAALLLLSAFSLTACTNLIPGQRPPPRFFRLSPKSTFQEDLPGVAWQLVVETPVANAGLDTTRIALMLTPQELEYYARANWTDRAPEMVQTLIVESFENSHRIVSVGRETLGLRADFVLKTELRELQAEYFHEGLPRAHVNLSAKLVKMPERTIVASKEFDNLVPAGGDKVEAVVEAFDSALGRSLKGLVSWTLRTGEAERGGAA